MSELTTADRISEIRARLEAARAARPAAEAGFDHPCKNTCSGWEQGRLRGRLDFQDDIQFLLSELKKARAQLDVAKEALESICDNKCHPEHNPCGAREALERIERMSDQAEIAEIGRLEENNGIPKN